MKSIRCLFAAGLALIAFAFAAPAPAAPIVYQTGQSASAAVGNLISQLNANYPEFGSLVTCTGTTTATCQGLRLQVSITGLTTAGAGAVSATMTVTDGQVFSTSVILCQVNGYSGAGVPFAVNIVPGAGSFAVAVQNNAASAALNATVPISCLISN